MPRVRVKFLFIVFAALLLATVPLSAPGHAAGKKWQPAKTPEEFMAAAAVIIDDYKTAVPLLEPLAAKGSVMAQSVLGQYYLKGLGVTRDFQRARQFLEKASAQGDDESTFTLAMMYEGGTGVAKDLVQSTRLLQLGADQGNAKSAFFLSYKS
jgi:TPR repeat protein